MGRRDGLVAGVQRVVVAWINAKQGSGESKVFEGLPLR